MTVNVNALIQQLNAAASMARDALGRAARAEASQAQLQQDAVRLATMLNETRVALARLEVSRTGDGKTIQRVENIPGRRIPMDMLVDIAIGDSVQSVQQGTITISQEGPFVAVSRLATLLSTFEFQYTDPTDGAVSAFQGRSYGRYRPIHSAWDLNDGQVSPQVGMALAFPGTGAPHVTSPATASSFRSMEGDFRIVTENAGSSFPRANLEVPSTFWSRSINEPFELGALDVFERAEVITLKVLPLHPNNPAYGNLSGFGAPNALFPFVDAGFDAIEGINDQNDPLATSADPVHRLANAVLTIGFHGYRIIQQIGLPG